MAERPLPSNKTNYAKTGNTPKTEVIIETETVSKMPQIVKQPGTVRKPTLGSKFKQAFTGDDVQSVGNYLFFDVIVPGAKNIIFDLLSEGARRVLFGTQGGGYGRGTGHGAPNRGTSYSRMYNGGHSGSSSAPQQREISARARSTHNFQEIVFPTRAEAEEVRDSLIAYIDEYTSVTVADFYQASGISFSHVDSKHGWYSMADSNIRNVRDGYLIELPPTVVID